MILTGPTWGSGLHAARSVAAAGGSSIVVTVGAEGSRVFGRSHWVARAVDVTGDPAAFDRELVDLLEGLVPQGPSVVLPTSDRLLGALHRNRDRFGERFALAIPPPEATERFLDKASANAAARSAGLDVLPTVSVVTSGDIEEAVSLAERDRVIIRPSRVDGRGQPFKIEVVRGPEHARRVLTGLVADGVPVVVQRHLAVEPGAVEFALSWTDRRGARTDVVCGRKRRQTSVDGGVMVWGETADLPDVASAARRLVSATGFSGVGGLEVIRSAGRCWFVEWNARLEAIHFLATAAGVDLVGLAYREHAGLPLPPVRPAGRASAWVGAAFLDQLRSPAGRSTAAGDWWRFQRAPGRVRAVWSWRDPRPGLGLLALLGRGALGRHRRDGAG